MHLHRDASTREILTYDLIEISTIFNEDLLTKPDKASFVKELEKNLSSTHCNFNSISSLHTSIIVDFMGTIKKVTLHDLSSIGHIFQAMLKRIEYTGTAQDLHLVYDSYLEHSTKECERLRRMGDNASVEYVDLSIKSPIPVQIDHFWSC